MLKGAEGAKEAQAWFKQGGTPLRRAVQHCPADD